MSRRLQIQTVLFNGDDSQASRFLEGIRAAVRHAAHRGVIDEVDVAIGDCSAAPTLSESLLAELRSGHLTPMMTARYEFFDANLGSGGGHNRLAATSASDELLIINPDTYAQPAMITELTAVLRSDATIGIAEARQIPIEHPKEFDPITGDTGWASGCCFITTSALFAELGGFDDEFFPLYCDDVDFSWRTRLASRRVVFSPRAGVVHDKRLTASGDVAASAAEQYHGALARLMLAVRYDRPDAIEATRRHLRDDACAPLRQAESDFAERLAAGQVPATIAGASRVAWFEEDWYAHHRF